METKVEVAAIDLEEWGILDVSVILKLVDFEKRVLYQLAAGLLLFFLYNSRLRVEFQVSSMKNSVSKEFTRNLNLNLGI